MNRVCAVLGLAMCLVAGSLVFGQEKPKSEAEKFKEFKPGSDATYNWLTDLTEAEKAVKEQKSPLMIYFYCPDDKKNAYLFETKIFADPQFSTVGGKFITVKINSSDEKALGPFKGTCRGRTAVKFMDPHLRPAGSLTMPSPVAFKRIVEAIEKKLAAKTSKEDAEDKKKEEKEDKDEKKDKE